MNRERHDRISRVFGEAIALPAPERSAFVERMAGDDPDLAARVHALLAADAEDDAAFDAGAGAPVAAAAMSGAAPEDVHATPPERIGRYRIVRTIGAGGMGVVYEARQDSPRRHVALKVIRGGRLSPTLLARFRIEAQVLGRLTHPGIAQIHEAGTDDTGDGIGSGGIPFVAMELVDGPPIIEYARSRALGVRKRLELIAAVADAVHHAHGKGVIHRDLKPSNVLVTEDDRGRAQPKVLDFGVARATDADVHTVTLRTDVGQLVGTVPYMSPEQASGDPNAIDARSDVYALGALAYELLVARLPITVEGLMIHEAVRRIREDEPARLGSVDRRLRGDVETIIARAMEKDPGRRYQSADAFAEDLRRHLADRPIVARPASTLEQLRRFSRRHRALVVGAATVLLTSVVGAAVAGRYAFLANRNAAALVEREAATLEYAATASMAAAAAAIRDGDYPTAARHLDQIDAARRGWEWRHLDARLQAHRETWPAPPAGLAGRPVLLPAEDVVMAVLEDGRIARWRTHDGESLSSFTLGPGLAAPIDTAGISPGATRTGHRAGPFTVALAPDGRRAAARRTDGRLVIRAIGDGTDADADATDLVIPGTRGIARPVAWDHAGERLLFGDDDGTAIWDGRRTRRIDARPPRFARFNPDASAVFVATNGRGIYRFDLAAATEPPTSAYNQLFGDEVISLDVSPDGRILAVGGAFRTLLVLDAATLEVLERLDSHRTTITSLAFERGGRTLLSASLDGSMRRWAVDTWQTTWRGTASERDALAITLPREESDVLVLGRDARVYGPDAGTGRVLTVHEGYVYYVAFSPDGTLIASSALADSEIIIRRVADGAVVGRFPMPGRGWYIFAAPCVQFTPDGRRVLAFHNRGIRLHDLESDTTREIEVTADPDWFQTASNVVGRAGTRHAHGTAWSPDGSVWASTSATAGHIRVERGDEAGASSEIPGSTGTTGIAFAPDGRHLAWTGHDGRVHVHAVATGDAVRTLDAHVGPAYAAAYHPTEPRLATGGEDGVIRIWDTTDGSLQLELRDHDLYVRALEFSPDGSILASASGDGTVRLWDTIPQERRRATAP